MSVQPVKKITRLVTQIHGFNPGAKTLGGNNIYLVGGSRNRTLIDTGEAKNVQCLGAIEDAVRREGVCIDRILLTHWHPDHVGGVGAIMEKICPEAEVFKAPLHPPTNSSTVEIHKQALIDEFRPRLSETGPTTSYHDLINFDFQEIQDGDVFKGDDFTLTSIFTPGHALDHTCFYLEEERRLFTGDNILGGAYSRVEDLHTYLQSLHKMKQFPSELLYTAHGPHEPPETIDRYISHRLKREEQFIQVLEDSPGSEFSPEQLVQLVYVPEGLKPNLWAPAANNVLATLVKLFVEDRVARGDKLAENFKAT